MAIKVITREEANQYRQNSELEQLKKLERETVDQIKVAIELFVDIESIYELKDYIDNIVREWHEFVIEGGEDE